MYDTIVTY